MFAEVTRSVAWAASGAEKAADESASTGSRADTRILRGLVSQLSGNEIVPAIVHDREHDIAAGGQLRHRYRDPVHRARKCVQLRALHLRRSRVVGAPELDGPAGDGVAVARIAERELERSLPVPRLPFDTRGWCAYLHVDDLAAWRDSGGHDVDLHPRAEHEADGSRLHG